MNKNYLLPIISFGEQIMCSGKGSYVYDVEGKKYLDLNSGQFCTVLGHSNEEILSAVEGQMKKLVHTSSSILADEVLLCAENIHELSGDMHAYSILLSTGAEAVEFAIRYAKHMKKKSGVICFHKGYHGLTLGTQSVTFGGKFACPEVSNVYTTEVPPNFIDEVEEEQYILKFEELVKEVADKVAVVMMEPVVSVGGMMFPSSTYFKRVREICDAYDVLLAFDESQTGFGRLGSWFAYQELDVVPDIVCLAKGIGQGYPVSMVLFRDSLVPEDGYAMTHYSSHQNDAFAASIVDAGIDYIEKYRLLERVQQAGNYFLKKLTELSDSCRYIRNPRGKGLMLGADLYYEGLTNYRQVYHDLYDKMMEKGVIIQGTDGGRVLRFLPDYLIAEADIDFAIDTLREVLDDIEWEKYGV